MKKILLILASFYSVAYAEQCQITSPLPVPVSITGCTFSGSLPSNSTSYIQNTLNPTTTTQMFSVQTSSVSGSQTLGFLGGTQCLQEIGGVVSGAGSACGVAGVTGVNSSGNAFITGNVTLQQGSNVTLSQSGSTITIASSGGGGGGVTLSSFTASQPILYNNTTGAFSATFISLSTGIVGTLGTGNGGTGLTSAQSAVQPILYNSGTGVFSSTLISATTDMMGTFQAAQFPALTGDITTSAGSLATTAATLQNNITTFGSSITINGSGGQLVKYGLTAGSATVSNLGINTNVCTNGSSQLTTSGCNNGTITLASLSATQPVLYNSGTGAFSATAISLSTGVVGILPAANFVSTAAYLTSTQTFTGGQTFSSATVVLLNGVTPGLVAGTNITSITGTWPNQTINAATQSGGGGGSSSLAVQQNAVNVTSPTVAINFLSPPFTVTLVNGSTSQVALNGSSVTLQGTVTAASLGALTANQTITLSGDSTGSGTTAIAVTAAGAQPDITTLSNSSTTVSGTKGLVVTWGVSASTLTSTNLASSGNICSSNGLLTTTGCSNGTLTNGSLSATQPILYNGSGVFSATSISLSTGIVGILSAANMVSTTAFTTSTQTWTATQNYVSTTSFMNTVVVSSSASGVPLVTLSTSPAVNPSDYLLTISSVSGTVALGIQNDSHVVSSGTTPSVSSCGTGSPAVFGTDMAGTITVGGGSVTACTLTFSSPYAIAPVCVESDNSTTPTADITSISTTAVTFGFSASIGGGTIWYICIGNKG